MAATPASSDEVFADWKQSVTELAKCPNVTMKLGGMMMRLAAYDYMGLDAPPSSEQLADALAPLCRDLHRIVRRRPLHRRKQLPGREDGHRLRRTVQRLETARAGCSADEKAAIFAGTARRVYRLDC